MAEDRVFRLYGFFRDGTIRDLFESSDIRTIYMQWIENVLDGPDCRHSVQLEGGEILWENDIAQAEGIARGEEPLKVWKAAREDWETEEMRQVPWHKFGYTDFWG